MIAAGDDRLGRSRRAGILLALLVTIVPVALLYGAHLHDPLLFDSTYWFGDQNARALSHPGGTDRYLSRLAAHWIQRASGGRPEALRVASVGMHLATALALFVLLRRLLPLATGGERPPGAALALAAVFTLHPVQVYAVAYHGQMELVMATLFAVLMLLAYVEGLARASPTLLLLAVLAYLCALLSKENLVAMPAVALAVTLGLRRPRAGAWGVLVRRAWSYFALCAMIGAWIVVRELGEARPDARGAVAALGGEHLHAQSIVTQGYLFFRYLAIWLAPNVSWMSIDIQYPVARHLLAWPETAGFVAFCLYPLAAAWLLLRGGRVGLIGLGLSWPWLLFLPELATTRLMESFVLYRGYPWIAGFLIALVVAAASWLGRAAAPVLLVACLGLAGLTHERLSTFRSAHAVWDDAIQKNRAWEGRAVGAYRAYVNRGTALLGEGRPDAALRDFETARDLSPETPYASLNAGLARVGLGQYEEALRDFDEGLAKSGDMPPTARAAAHSNRAGVYLLLGRPRDAVEDLAQAAALDPARAEYGENLRRLRAELAAR